MSTIEKLIDHEIKQKLGIAQTSKNSKLPLLVVAAGTFLVTTIFIMLIASAGQQGKFELKFGSFEFIHQFDNSNIKELLSEKKNDPPTKLMAKQVFSLHELDTSLMAEIESLPYYHPLSKQLRTLRDKELGPFDAPQVPVELSFSPDIEHLSADVCPDSDFRDKSMNILVSDKTQMQMINHVDSHNMLSMADCPVKDKIAANEPERIIVSQKFAESLLDTDALPLSVTAIAREVSGLIIIPPKSKE